MPTRTQRVIAASVLLAMLAGGAVIWFWPTPIDTTLGVPLHYAVAWLRPLGLTDAVGYSALETLANVLLFVPLGFALALLMPSGRRWLAPTLCVALSLTAEFGQALLRPARFADPMDVLANTIGALVGTWLVIQMLRRRERAPRR
jgi:VanZ family protein